MTVLKSWSGENGVLEELKAVEGGGFRMSPMSSVCGRKSSSSSSVSTFW